MPQHLADRFGGNMVLQGDRGGEGMPGRMGGQLYVDAADSWNFFQVTVEPLGTPNRQEFSVSRVQ